MGPAADGAARRPAGPAFGLRFRITGTLILVVLVTTLFAAFFTVRQSYEALKLQKQQDELVVARNVAAQVDEVLAKARQTVESLGEYSSIRDGGLEEQRQALTLVARVTELIDGFVIWGPDGTSRVMDLTEPDTRQLVPGSASEQLVSPVLSSGQTMFSRVYRPEGGEGAVLAITAPIRRGGAPVGALSGVILMKNHSMGGIEAIRIGKSGYAYIVDEEGNVIVHPQRERLHENLRQHPPVEALLKSREGVIEFTNQDGIKVVAAYAPVRETGWGVVVRQPASESYSYADAMFHRLTWVFVGGLLLACAIGIPLAWRLSAPLESLAGAVQQVGEGNLDIRIDERGGDEIGRLGRAFNEMTRNLRLHQEKISQARRQLVQSEKMAAIGQLAAGLAHEIHNPLNVISGFSDFLLGKTPEGDPRRGPLQDISRETVRCQRLVAELLHFARPKRAERAPHDLNRLVEETLSLVHSEAKTRGVRVESLLQAGLPPVAMDRDQMKQVFLNILLNACQAMPDGGDLRVRSFRDGTDVAVEVRDSGHGIPPENIDKIFDPFFTTKERGTGLGLALSYAIVEQHGGSLEARSRPGEGASFLVRLPEGAHAA
jgi:two-component system, NtrC family, sensor kinase